MNAVVMKLSNPNATGLIFVTGKIVLTGVKSEVDMHQAANNLLERIKQCGYPDAKINDIQIQNLVASVDVGFHIKLGQLSDACKKYCSFEPELFPGLVYRMEEPKVSIMVFNSGKINLTGSKSQTQILDAFEKIYPILSQFKY